MIYSDNMTDKEAAEFLEEILIEDAIYASLVEDTKEYSEEEQEEACQDETLRRAALNRGQP